MNPETMENKRARRGAAALTPLSFDQLPDDVRAAILHNLLSPEVKFATVSDCVNRVLGRLLSVIRASQGASQEEVARALGTSQAMISRIESEPLEVKVRFIREYCSHFELPYSEVLEWVEGLAGSQCESEGGAGR